MITSNIQGVSYTEMLANSQQKPFKVGETMLVSSSAGQTEQTVMVQHKTDTGKVQQFTIAPVQDPYQQLKDRTISSSGNEFILDGFASLTLNQLNVGATITMYLYLKKRYNPTMLVDGRNPDMKFSEAKIMRFLA